MSRGRVSGAEVGGDLLHDFIVEVDAFMDNANGHPVLEMRWLGFKALELAAVAKAVQQNTLSDGARKALAQYRLAEVTLALDGFDQQRAALLSERNSLEKALGMVMTVPSKGQTFKGDTF